MKRKRNMLALTIIFLTITAIGIDLFTSFWSGYTFLAGLTTGFVTLGTSLFIVDQWLQRRNNKRWAVVADVGYKGLGLFCSRFLEFLASAYINLSEIRTLTEWDVSSDYSQLSPWSIMEFAKFSSERLSLKVFEREVLADYRSHPFAQMPKERMLQLMKDREWGNWFEQRLYDFRMKHFSAVAEWAPLMMHSEEAREMLNYFSMLNVPLLLSDRRMKMVQQRGLPIDMEWLFAQLFLLDIRTRFLANELFTRGHNRVHFILDDRIAKMCLAEVFDAKNEELLVSFA